MQQLNYWEVGDEFIGLLVETIEGNSRPRVKPLYGPDIKVNFPTKIREDYPIGTRFSINGKVSQKPNQKPYIYADRNSIVVINDYKPRKRVFAEKIENMKSNRVYKYIEV